MGEMAMMVASMAFKGLEMMSQNAALKQQQRARDEQARLEVEELKRQQRRADLIAQEEKSDVARAFDLELGSLIAASADGGVTAAALARAGGAAGAIAGLDTARIESNRQEAQSGRRAESLAIIMENAAARKQTKSAIASNTLSFFGNAAGTLAQSDFAFNATPTSTPSYTAPAGGGTTGLSNMRKPLTSTPTSRNLLTSGSRSYGTSYA